MPDRPLPALLNQVKSQKFSDRSSPETIQTNRPHKTMKRPIREASVYKAMYTNKLSIKQ
jgi:hypothetical protein